MTIAPQNIMSKLRLMPDAELASFARAHQKDPYIFPLAFQESQTRQRVRASQQAQQAGMEQPKVVDQAVAEMQPQQLPEDVGIAQIPAPNMQSMAGGGIVAFAGGGTPFAQWLAERGITMQQYAQLPASEQQLMREVFRNPGPTMPAAAAAPVAAAAAAPVAAEAATTGRAYQTGRMLGKGLAKAGPAVAGIEVLENLGSYKFKEPNLDTSVGGVYDALKAGNYSQAGRNLVMGVPEAGYDLLRSGAGLGDYVLPGQPLAEGVDKMVKYFHGDNITTPSDAARAEEAAKKATDAQKAANAAATKAKEDFKITSGTPTGNIMGSRRTPLQLAEEAAKNEAAAKERAGLANLMKMPSVGAPAAATPSGLGSISEFAKEANAYTGADPTAKQLERIEKQESAAAGEKKDAMNMALLKAGLGMMAGTSRYAFENIGKGAMGGLEDYAGTMKELKKAALERDKMRDAAEQAAFAYKRDDVKGYRDAKEKEAQRAAELQRTQMTIAGQLQAAGIGRAATLEAAKLPGAQERFYATLGDPNSAAAKGFKYASEVGAEAKANPALVAQYAKNPMALEMLKTTDPILYASIKQQMLAMAMPQVQTAPTGEIRR